MRSIFVMIRCQLGQAYEVASHLVDEIDETAEVHSTSAPHQTSTWGSAS